MKKSSKIIITFILPLLIGCSSKSDYNETYFGKEKYQEIKYQYTDLELAEVQPILNKIEEAFSYIDTNHDCEIKFRKLNRYCFCNDTYPEIYSETHSIQLVTTRIVDDQGYLWIKYTHEGFNQNNEEITGSSNVLSRIEFKKENDQWIILSIDEAI